MTDRFSIEVEKLKKLERVLKTDINKRNEQETKKLSTSILEAGIRGQFEEIQRVIKSVNNNEITNTRNLSQNEVNRRLGIIQETSNGMNKLKNSYDSVMSKNLMEKNKQNLLLNSDNNSSLDNTLHLSTSDMLKLQEDKIKKQDGMLDELHGLLISSKKANQEIDNEIKIQTPMLKDLDKQMDSVQGRMKRAQGKLNQYFEKSSSSCLMTVICLQVLLLLVIVLLL